MQAALLTAGQPEEAAAAAAAAAADAPPPAAEAAAAAAAAAERVEGSQELQPNHSKNLFQRRKFLQSLPQPCCITPQVW